MSETALSHPKYRPDIDGLRALAVLAVVAFHAFPNWLKGGFVGVDIFFVISGYLIATIIFENLDKSTFSFAGFYARRIKRIFPALILVLISCFVLGWFVLLPDEFEQLGKHIASGAVFVSNLTLWNESGYFDKAANTKPLLHLWSLGIEEQFYIFWPLILWFAHKKRLNLLCVGILIALVSFYLNIHQVKTDAVADFYSPQTRFWELLCGSILAWLTLYKPGFSAVIPWKTSNFFNQYKNNGKDLAGIISIVAFLLVVYGFFRINSLGFPGKWALIPVLSTVLLIFSGPKAWINRIILSNKIVIWFGLISYPLYLWHWPLLSFSRIIENKTPSISMRIEVVVLSIMLAWLTYVLIERPVRFGKHGKMKVTILVISMITVGYVGFHAYKKHGFPKRLNNVTYETMPIKRKDFDKYAILLTSWYRGKHDWLFLGNNYDKTVAKLELSMVPPNGEIQATKNVFEVIAKTGARYNTKVALIIGPNKSSIYPEYLPNTLIPSKRRYISYFLDKLKNISNLIVYDPTDDLLRLKKSEGVLYWMTDTHWNNKGAFLAYAGFLKFLGISIPDVHFQHTITHSGDLIAISKLKNFPLHREDNWDVIWKNKPNWKENKIPDQQETPFGDAAVVINVSSLSNKYVWVVGDSFSRSLRQYLNATFKEVRYVGHWEKTLKELPEDLINAHRKPDMIIIERVERSF